MIHLELTEEEQHLLADVLDTNIGELRLEIANTDNAEYREMLKQRERVLRQLLAELQSAPITV